MQYFPEIRLKAATLVEALVAGAVFMTIFLITMNTATAIVSVPDMKERIEIEQALGSCMEKFHKEEDTLPGHTSEYRFGWGTVIISTESYSGDILKVTLTAKINGGRNISYRMLYPAGQQ